MGYFCAHSVGPQRDCEPGSPVQANAHTDDSTAMSAVTFGKLMIAAARSGQKQQMLSPEQVRQATRAMVDTIQPKLDKMRAEEQRVLEESKPIVLR